MKPKSATVKASLLGRLKDSGFDLDTLTAQDYTKIKKVLPWKESTYKTALAYLGKKSEANQLAGGFRDYIPTDAEVKVVCDSLGPFGVTLAAIGCRYAEMWTMEINDGRYLTINTQKKGEKVVINLDEVALSVVRAIKTWIAIRDSQSQHIIRRKWTALRDCGKLDSRCVPHSFRHRKVTLLKQLGVSMEEIAKSVGHASIATTYRYFHSNPSNQAKLTNQVIESFV